MSTYIRRPLLNSILSKKRIAELTRVIPSDGNPSIRYSTLPLLNADWNLASRAVESLHWKSVFYSYIARMLEFTEMKDSFDLELGKLSSTADWEEFLEQIEYVPLNSEHQWIRLNLQNLTWRGGYSIEDVAGQLALFKAKGVEAFALLEELQSKIKVERVAVFRKLFDQGVELKVLRKRWNWPSLVLNANPNPPLIFRT